MIGSTKRYASHYILGILGLGLLASISRYWYNVPALVRIPTSLLRGLELPNAIHNPLARRVQAGMTAAEVEELLGSPAYEVRQTEESKRNWSDGRKNEWCYKNHLYRGNICVAFDGSDRVLSVSAGGLL